MCGIKTRGRGRKKSKLEVNGDPKQMRSRRRKGNNRSKKLQAGLYDRPGGKQPVSIQPAGG